MPSAKHCGYAISSQTSQYVLQNIIIERITKQNFTIVYRLFYCFLFSFCSCEQTACLPTFAKVAAGISPTFRFCLYVVFIYRKLYVDLLL